VALLADIRLNSAIYWPLSSPIVMNMEIQLSSVMARCLGLVEFVAVRVVMNTKSGRITAAGGQA
jgi:hypothetical protein